MNLSPVQLMGAISCETYHPCIHSTQARLSISNCISNLPVSISWLTWKSSLAKHAENWSFLCMHTHTGVGHTDNESAQQFWLGVKLSQTFVLYSWWRSNLWSLDLESDALPIEPPRPPNKYSTHWQHAGFKVYSYTAFRDEALRLFIIISICYCC